MQLAGPIILGSPVTLKEHEVIQRPVAFDDLVKMRWESVVVHQVHRPVANVADDALVLRRKPAADDGNGVSLASAELRESAADSPRAVHDQAMRRSRVHDRRLSNPLVGSLICETKRVTHCSSPETYLIRLSASASSGDQGAKTVSARTNGPLVVS